MPAMPDWERVYQGVREGIRSGRWSPGDEVPSSQEFAAQFKVSQSTVDSAMRLLVREGWLVGHPGKGRFVADPLPSA
jgi:DNA-binding GntR family transcriptional regulator